MSNPNVNVVVSGPKNDYTSTYKTYILRGNMSFADQVTEPNMKYVIKYDFDLGGSDVTVPENCILEFDGGSLKNGTIIGQDTAFFNVGDVEIWGENLTRQGTWEELHVGVQSDWNQTDENAFDYIKNKPEVYTKTETDEKYQPKGNYQPAGNYAPASDTQRIVALENAVGSGGSVDTRISVAVDSEATRAKAAEQGITSTVTSRLDTQDAEIALLNGAEVIVVEDHTAVSSPDPQKIYREIGDTSYTDWMNQTGNANDWKAIATYNPGIDETPTAGSNNLVKSGGVASTQCRSNQYPTSLINVNSFICEMYIPDSIANVSDISYIVIGTNPFQLFLLDSQGTRLVAVTLVKDGNIYYSGGVYLYCIDTPTAVSYQNVVISEQVQSLVNSPHIAQYIKEHDIAEANNFPSDNIEFNNAIKELYFGQECGIKASDIKKIQLNNTSEGIAQVFFLGVNDSVIKGYTLDNVDSLKDVYSFGADQSISISIAINNWPDHTINWFKRYEVVLSEKCNNLECCPIIDGKKGINLDYDEVVWVGTSIPQGTNSITSTGRFGYPNMVSERIGKRIYNNAIGGSFVRYSNVLPTAEDYHPGLSLSMTRAEKMALYESLDIPESEKEVCYSTSLDDRLLNYINGVKAHCKVVVFDHGYNDQSTIMTDYNAIQNNTIDWNNMDRQNSYIGAVNYIINKVWEIDKSVRFVFVGYLENTLDGTLQSPLNRRTKQVCEVQEAFCRHFGYPIIKLWEMCGFSFDKFVPNTNNYLSEIGISTPKLIQDANGNISTFQYNCPDGVHPHSSRVSGGAYSEYYITKILINALIGLL